MAKKHRKTKKTKASTEPQNKEIKSEEPKLSLRQKILSRKNIAAALLAILSWGGGELLGHISPYLKVTVWLIASLLLVWLEVPFKRWLEKLLSQSHLQQKTLTILSISPIMLLAIFLFVFAFPPLVRLETSSKAIEEIGNITPIHVKQPNTVVRCCLRGDTYQVWAQNGGDKEDTVVITLGTTWVITDWYPIMGASLPTKLEGGINANFITFKINDLIPGMSLSYIVEIAFSSERPYKFTAWSEETGNISAIFIGNCPDVGASWDPVETRPP